MKKKKTAQKKSRASLRRRVAIPLTLLLGSGAGYLVFDALGVASRLDSKEAVVKRSRSQDIVLAGQPTLLSRMQGSSAKSSPSFDTFEAGRETHLFSPMIRSAQVASAVPDALSVQQASAQSDLVQNGTTPNIVVSSPIAHRLPPVEASYVASASDTQRIPDDPKFAPAPEMLPIGTTVETSTSAPVASSELVLPETNPEQRRGREGSSSTNERKVIFSIPVVAPTPKPEELSTKPAHIEGNSNPTSKITANFAVPSNTLIQSHEELRRDASELDRLPTNGVGRSVNISFPLAANENNITSAQDIVDSDTPQGLVPAQQDRKPEVIRIRPQVIGARKEDETLRRSETAGNPSLESVAKTNSSLAEKGDTESQDDLARVSESDEPSIPMRASISDWSSSTPKDPVPPVQSTAIDPLTIVPTPNQNPPAVEEDKTEIAQEEELSIVPSAKMDLASRAVQSVRMNEEFDRIESRSPEICSIVKSNKNEFTVVGGKIGKTLLLVWPNSLQGSEDPIGIEVHVTRPFSDASGTEDSNSVELQKTIQRMFPESRIEIHPNGDGSISVKGVAHTEESAKQILIMIRKICLIPVHDCLVVQRR